jgi:hypothetical protein
MRLLNEEDMITWSDTKDAMVKELGLEMHRAANDVTLLRETYKKIKNI